jgi:ubiquinone biosynthesis protein
MNVLSTASNIGQAFLNAGRVTEIVSVMVTHGFAEVMHRMKLARFISRSENPRYKDMPHAERLRLSFEALGPTFIKLGQLLATRSDLIPEEYVEQFQKLQDDVKFVPFSDIRQVVDEALRGGFNTEFSSFNETPMAAASIAQVHGAVLKTGEKVAVKVQRPGIERLIQGDIAILRGLAILIEKYVPELRTFNPRGLVEEFFQTIQFELDFRVEANNIKKIKNNLSGMEKIVVPNVFSEVSSEKIIVLELLEGVRFSDREEILRRGINPVEVIETGADAFFHMVMHDGVFHGDLHAGNLFVLADGKIGIIDFGIVGRLSRRVRDSIITMFIAIMDEDYETIANEYVTLCQNTGTVDFAQLQKDLMDTISPYVGMALGEVNAGKLLLRSTATAVRHNLVVPRELMLLFKSIAMIDGLGKKLDPTFDVLQLGNRLAKQLLTSRYSRERIVRDLVFLGRDLQSTFEIVPRLLRRFLRVWSQNNFAIETRNRDIAALARSIQIFSYVFLLSVAGSCLFATGLLVLKLQWGPYLMGMPVGTGLPIFFALVLLLHAWRVLRKERS